MGFATLQDVARKAGVSYATVDRVVNDRGGVAQKSVLRVQQAIDALGYQRDESAANLARRRAYRFHFLLPEGRNPFFAALSAALERQRQSPTPFRTAIDVSRVPPFDGRALMDVLDALDTDRTDCVCMVAFDAPDVIAAVGRARNRGLKIVTLVSDVSAQARDCYVGIDNLVAGKTAGRMMGLAHRRSAGLVLPIIGATRAQDHAQRLDGFRAVLSTHFPRVRVLDSVVSRDDPEAIGEILKRVAAQNEALSGVYNVGAGNEGLIAWVGTRAPDDRPFTVIHEMLPVSRRALEAGLIDTVIDQKPDQAVAQALSVMRRLVDGQPLPHAAETVTPAIYLCENLPPDMSSTDREP